MMTDRKCVLFLQQGLVITTVH